MDAETRKCTRCQAQKPITHFRFGKYRLDGTRSRCWTCRDCHGNDAYQAEWRKKNRVHLTRILNAARWRRWGIKDFTLEDFDRMLATQGGVCAICGGVNRSGRAMHVDHDHDTGRVRGLLCYLCNKALGLFGEDAGKMNAALAYLMKHSNVVPLHVAQRIR